MENSSLSICFDGLMNYYDRLIKTGEHSTEFQYMKKDYERKGSIPKFV